jgi:hypothetical protein
MRKHQETNKQTAEKHNIVSIGSCYALRAAPAAVADGVVKPPALKAQVGVQPRQPRRQALTHLQQQRQQLLAMLLIS